MPFKQCSQTNLPAGRETLLHVFTKNFICHQLNLTTKWRLLSSTVNTTVSLEHRPLTTKSTAGFFKQQKFQKELENLSLTHEMVKDKLKHLEAVSVIKHNYVVLSNISHNFMRAEWQSLDGGELINCSDHRYHFFSKEKVVSVTTFCLSFRHRFLCYRKNHNVLNLIDTVLPTPATDASCWPN
jgi:hypothetical protein